MKAVITLLTVLTLLNCSTQVMTQEKMAQSLAGDWVNDAFELPNTNLTIQKGMMSLTLYGDGICSFNGSKRKWTAHPDLNLIRLEEPSSDCQSQIFNMPLTMTEDGYSFGIIEMAGMRYTMRRLDLETDHGGGQ